MFTSTNTQALNSDVVDLLAALYGDRYRWARDLVRVRPDVCELLVGENRKCAKSELLNSITYPMVSLVEGRNSSYWERVIKNEVPDTVDARALQPRGHADGEFSNCLRNVNRATMYMAHIVARENSAICSTLFGCSIEVASMLATLTLRQFETLREVSWPLVQLRRGDDSRFWAAIIEVVSARCTERGDVEAQAFVSRAFRNDFLRTPCAIS